MQIGAAPVCIQAADKRGSLPVACQQGLSQEFCWRQAILCFARKGCSSATQEALDAGPLFVCL